jgi:hypothetical protein
MPSLTFRITDFTSTGLSPDVRPKIKLIPFYSPLIYSGSIITADPSEQDLDVTSSATFFGVVPNVYTAEVWTTKIETTFNVLVPTTVSESLDASDYILENFTGSSASSAFRIVPIPETTASFGKEGWIALAEDYLYVYSGNIWLKTPLTIW